MRVAICDDLKADRDTLAKFVESVFDDKKLQVFIDYYDSGEMLWQSSSDERYDIYFLDIYMKKLSGVELGYELIKKYPTSAIVFTTSSKDFMYESYDIGAVHYIIKPFSQNDVDVAIERCLRIVQKVEPYIEVLINREKKRIQTAMIRYIESQSRYCVIHTTTMVYKVYLRLEKLDEMLNESKFIRCHRSYIVNLDYVKDVKDYDYLMDDETFIPIRRNQKRLLKNYYEDYLFEQTRMKRR